MIEPNIQGTVGSPIEFYKFEVMRDLISVKDAWESYAKQDASGLPCDTGLVKARTQSLFNSLYPYLQRKWDAKKFDGVKKNLFSAFMSLSDLRDVFWDIQVQLDKDQILKMDTHKSFDRTLVEKENENFYL